MTDPLTLDPDVVPGPAMSESSADALEILASSRPYTPILCTRVIRKSQAVSAGTPMISFRDGPHRQNVGLAQARAMLADFPLQEVAAALAAALSDPGIAEAVAQMSPLHLGPNSGREEVYLYYLPGALCINRSFDEKSAYQHALLAPLNSTYARQSSNRIKIASILFIAGPLGTAHEIFAAHQMLSRALPCWEDFRLEMADIDPGRRGNALLGIPRVEGIS